MTLKIRKLSEVAELSRERRSAAQHQSATMKKGWPQVRVGDVILENSKSKLKVRDSISDGKYPFYTSGVSINSFDDFLCDGNNLFIATGGKACLQYYEGKAAYSTDCYSVTTRQGFAPKFLFYFLDSILEDIDVNMFEGAALRHLQKTKFRELLVPSPPLAEQQRIVGLLDEAFVCLASTKANAEKNLQNARALFESHLQSVFTQRVGSLAFLSELADEVTDGDHSPPPKAPTGVPFITISDIDKRTRTIDFSNTFTVPEAYFCNLKASKKPRVGDVLYTVTGATLGIPILVREQRDFCFQRHIGLIRPNAGADSSWLTYALRSPQVFRQATMGSTGAAQKTVSLSVLRTLKLPKVSLNEQKKIASKLDALSEETQRLAHIYERKITLLDELKKSVLAKAFAGEL